MARSSRMKALIDSHVLLWALLSPERLSGAARSILEDPETTILVSHASGWELTIKSRRLGLDPIRRFLEEAMKDLAAMWLPIEISHIAAVADLPPVHGDPFDRMLIAQAVCEGVPVVSGDTVFSRYPLSVIW